MENQTDKQWKNEETSVVALWIKDDEANRERWDELAYESLKLSSRPEELRDDAIAGLADELKFVMSQSVPQGIAIVYRNLIFAALGKVDWLQIADDYLGVVTTLGTKSEIWSGPRPGHDSDPRFPLGRVVSTPGALDSIESIDMLTALARHHRGDWGNCCEDDWEANEEALVVGSKILSIYRARNGEQFWIITDANRSVTTILLPSEY